MKGRSTLKPSSVKSLIIGELEKPGYIDHLHALGWIDEKEVKSAKKVMRIKSKKNDP